MKQVKVNDATPMFLTNATEVICPNFMCNLLNYARIV